MYCVSRINNIVFLVVLVVHHSNHIILCTLANWMSFYTQNMIEQRIKMLRTVPHIVVYVGPAPKIEET